MLVNNLLEISAARHPGKTALVAKGVRHTYSEIDSLSARFASALASDGFERGERVAIFLDNSVEAVTAVFGALKAGGVFMMINPTTKAEKLSFILNNSRASHLVAHSEKADLVSKAASSCRHLKRVYFAGNGAPGTVKGISSRLDEALAASPPSPRLLRGTIDADLANIVYTSGSTGFPKGVMMTHLNMVSAINSITGYLENTSEDVILNTLPMSFDYGLYQVLMAFKSCATVILEKGFLYPYKLIELLLKEKVTGLPIVPTISAILIQMDDIKKNRFDSLRYITNTAAALPVAHIKKLKEFFPGARVYSMYGLTECKRVSYLPPEELDRRPGSVGKAMPNTEAFIVDEQGRRVGPNVTGELVVRGSNVMRGYWEMPEETARRLKPGKFPGDVLLHTGDLFRMDEDGFLYFVARKDDIIKSRGEKVSPREIEDVLHTLEGVAEAAVVGTPDPVLGQAIRAYVTLKDGAKLTKADVLRHCQCSLEDFMVPRDVVFTSGLPKTTNGKVDRAALGEAMIS